jgi:hypothetical protein
VTKISRGKIGMKFVGVLVVFICSSLYELQNIAGRKFGVRNCD